MTGLCTRMCLPTRMHSDKAGETETTVKGDSISFSRGVTSFSVGHCGGFGLCLYWPSGPAGLHCEQIPGEWLTDIFRWCDSILVVVVSLGLACCTYLHFTWLHHPPGCGFHSPAPCGNLLAFFLSQSTYYSVINASIWFSASVPHNTHKLVFSVCVTIQELSCYFKWKIECAIWKVSHISLWMYLPEDGNIPDSLIFSVINIYNMVSTVNAIIYLPERTNTYSV